MIFHFSVYPYFSTAKHVVLGTRLEQWCVWIRMKMKMRCMTHTAWTKENLLIRNLVTYNPVSSSGLQEIGLRWESQEKKIWDNIIMKSIFENILAIWWFKLNKINVLNYNRCFKLTNVFEVILNNYLYWISRLCVL